LSLHPLPLRERDCYACFDMERGGRWTCPACGRPYGNRLPEAQRPQPPLHYWLDPTLDPRPPAEKSAQGSERSDEGNPATDEQNPNSQGTNTTS
jgi:hypothetical protein